MGVYREMNRNHTGQYTFSPIVVGVDEAGRGPLAGPVAVGAVALLNPGVSQSLEGVNDSKKLSPGARSLVFAKALELQDAGALAFSVVFSDAETIDRLGIVPSISQALGRALRALPVPPEHAHVLLDGSLKAPAEFQNQKTIIRGDETEFAIGLASIVAKVARDQLMEEEGSRYPQYGFEKHKGYGTVFHYQAIREHGLCPLHRVSFVDLTKIK